MADGKGTKTILSILIIMIVVCVICYLVYEKKSLDLIFNQDDMIPNLFKAQPDQVEEEVVEEEEVVVEEEEEDENLDQVLNDKSIESFVSNTNLQNAAPVAEKKSCLGSRDTFLLNQNEHYSNCNDDCLNRKILENDQNLFKQCFIN